MIALDYAMLCNILLIKMHCIVPENFNSFFIGHFYIGIDYEIFYRLNIYSNRGHDLFQWSISQRPLSRQFHLCHCRHQHQDKLRVRSKEQGGNLGQKDCFFTSIQKKAVDIHQNRLDYQA